MLLILILLICLHVLSASAMDFSVMPVTPENQRNEAGGFFDLIVTPGQEQTIFIEVINESSNEIMVLAETITASTGRAGNINYTSRGILDETLAHSFEEMATLPEELFEIAANGRIRIPITLKIPEEGFDGAILGSIRVLREATNTEREAAGAIVNQFAHVTVVRLVTDENAEDILPDFIIGEINIQEADGSVSFSANIRNIMPKIVRGVEVNASIYQSGGTEAIHSLTMESVSFAPNSVLQILFPETDESALDTNALIAKISLSYGDEKWYSEQTIPLGVEAEPPGIEVIIQTASAQTNAQADRTAAPPEISRSMPIWTIISSIVIGAAIIIVVGIFIKINKPKAQMR